MYLPLIFWKFKAESREFETPLTHLMKYCCGTEVEEWSGNTGRKESYRRDFLHYTTTQQFHLYKISGQHQPSRRNMPNEEGGLGSGEMPVADVGGKQRVALRHAEKSRPFSTCEFADRIFAVSMGKLRELSPRFLSELESSPSPGYNILDLSRDD